MEPIKRDLYFKQLINRKENGLIKIINGIRRCGKSYLLFNIYHDYLLGCGVKESNIIALALDDDSNREYRNPDKLSEFLHSKITNKQECVRLEIDFVCNKGSNRYYVQSAFSIPDEAKMKQETSSLDNTKDSFKKVIVTQDLGKPWHNEKGYLIINVLDFLLNQNSLDL